MGWDIEFKDYGDYPLLMDLERINYLIDRILDIRPDVVLTHWHEDPFNVDHAVTAKAVVRAVSAAARLGARPSTRAHYFPDLFFFESTLPHSEFNRFEIDTYIDISGVFDLKIEAVKKFVSQPELVELYTRCGTHRGVQANDWAREKGRTIGQAEGYKRYTPYVGDRLPLSFSFPAGN
jgi:4-oxalomesaconate hydratase